MRDKSRSVEVFAVLRIAVLVAHEMMAGIELTGPELENIFEAMALLKGCLYDSGLLARYTKT